MPNSKIRKPAKTSNHRLRVRPPETVAELRQFEQWARLADAGGPLTAAALVEHHAAGILGSALHTNDPAPLHTLLRRGGPFTAGWARTVALIATRGDKVIGGLLAGPSSYLLENLQQQIGLPDEIIAHAMVITSKLHFVSVTDTHRGNGVGTALVQAAVARTADAGAALMYGQFPAADRGLAQFYRDTGFDLMLPGTPLNFAGLLGGAPVTPHPGPGEQFFIRALQPTP